MKHFTMQTEEAWSEIFEAIKGADPVDAVFLNANEQGSDLVIRIDGEPMNVHITLRRYGAWEATYFKENQQ